MGLFVPILAGATRITNALHNARNDYFLMAHSDIKGGGGGG